MKLTRNDIKQKRAGRAEEPRRGEIPAPPGVAAWHPWGQQKLPPGVGACYPRGRRVAAPGVIRGSPGGGRQPSPGVESAYPADYETGTANLREGEAFMIDGRNFLSTELSYQSKRGEGGWSAPAAISFQVNSQT